MIMISTPTTEHVQGDIHGDIDRTLHVVLVGAMEVSLIVVRLLVVHPKPQRVQEDPVKLDW